MKIYVVRHGQTKWNQEKRMQGAKNSDLTEVGIEEAQKLGEYLKDINFDMIYSSPLGRAVETTEQIKGDRDIPVTFIDELQEIDFGFLEGKVLEEAREKHTDMLYNLWNDPINYVNDTGESFDDVFKRVEKAFTQIISNKDQENVLVVTHGVIISVLFTILDGKGVKDTWENPIVKNTSFSIIEVSENNKVEIVSKSNVQHLE